MKRPKGKRLRLPILKGVREHDKQVRDTQFTDATGSFSLAKDEDLDVGVGVCDQRSEKIKEL